MEVAFLFRPYTVRRTWKTCSQSCKAGGLSAIHRPIGAVQTVSIHKCRQNDVMTVDGNGRQATSFSPCAPSHLGIISGGGREKGTVTHPSEYPVVLVQKMKGAEKRRISQLTVVQTSLKKQSTTPRKQSKSSEKQSKNTEPTRPATPTHPHTHPPTHAQTLREGNQNHDKTRAVSVKQGTAVARYWSPETPRQTIQNNESVTHTHTHTHICYFILYGGYGGYFVYGENLGEGDFANIENPRASTAPMLRPQSEIVAIKLPLAAASVHHSRKTLLFQTLATISRKNERML